VAHSRDFALEAEVGGLFDRPGCIFGCILLELHVELDPELVVQYELLHLPAEDGETVGAVFSLHQHALVVDELLEHLRDFLERTRPEFLECDVLGVGVQAEPVRLDVPVTDAVDRVMHKQFAFTLQLDEHAELYSVLLVGDDFVEELVVDGKQPEFAHLSLGFLDVPESVGQPLLGRSGGTLLRAFGRLEAFGRGKGVHVGAASAPLQLSIPTLTLTLTELLVGVVARVFKVFGSLQVFLLDSHFYQTVDEQEVNAAAGLEVESVLLLLKRLENLVPLTHF